MRARGLAGMLTALTLTAALASCAPSAIPTPTPSETGFASEAEAFAAAEETYRAYVDALNDVDLSDPATFEPVYALLEGDALDGSKKELTSLHADGLTKSGETLLDGWDQVDADLRSSDVELRVCLDVSRVDIQDSTGQSVVPADRNDFQALSVRFSSSTADPAALKIVGSDAAGDEPCG